MSESEGQDRKGAEVKESEPRFICETCKQVFKDEDSMAEHVNSSHQPIKEEYDDDVIPDDPGLRSPGMKKEGP